MKKNISDKLKPENSPLNTENIVVDFIAIFFVISYLIIDFIPYTSGIDIIGIQYLYLAFINLVIGFYLYKNPQLISKEFFGIFKNNNSIKSYLLFLLLCGISILASNHFSLSIISFTQLIIVFFMFLNISILLYNRIYLINKLVIIFVFFIFIQCILQLKQFNEISKTFGLDVGFSRLSGNTGSINIFAANLTSKIPFLLFAIYSFSSFKKWFSIFTLFLASLLVLLTSSRASFLGLSAEILVFSLLLFKINSNFKFNLKLIVQIIIPLFFSYLSANSIMSNLIEGGRFESVDSRIGQITDLSESSANTRLTNWENAFEIITNKPFLGLGIGNWQIESIPYEKFQANDLLFSIHTHNDFLEIASETGIINGILFLLVFIFGLIINLKRILNNTDQQTKLISLITLLLVITYGLDSVFNFPLHRPAMQFNLCLLLVLTLINIPKINTNTPLKNSKKGLLILILIITITIYFSYIFLQAQIIENEINDDISLPEKEQKLNSEYIKSKMPGFIEVNLNSIPFSEMLGKYYFQEKKYEKANACLNLSEKINPYTGKSDFLRAKIAVEKGLIDSAYFYSKRSLKIRPRCESYFFETINEAILKKDTINILKLHNDFSKYRNSPNYWLNTSSALIISKYSFKNTIKFIDEGLKEFPNDTSLISRRNSYAFDAETKKAYASMKEKKYNDAIEIYKKMIKNGNNNIAIYQNIGLCYAGMIQYANAIKYLEKALKLSNNNDGKTEYYLGICYYEIKNKEKGCYYLNLSADKKYIGAISIRDKYCK